MRNLANLSKWSFCLMAAAVAGCSGGTNDNNMAATNIVDANTAAPAEPAPDANAAAGDNAAVADNAAPPAEANGAAPAKAGAAFNASGSEPFWSLALGDAQMVYDSADGPDVTVATPKARQTRSGPEYITPQLKVHVNVVQHCTFEDGETKGDTVKVTVGGQTLTGCGNGDLPD
jgi:uncharacterized membrane protein